MNVDRKRYIEYAKYNDLFFVRFCGKLLFDCRRGSKSFPENIEFHKYYKIPFTGWRIRFFDYTKRK